MTGLTLCALGCGGGGNGDGGGHGTTRELKFPTGIRGGAPRFSPDGTRLAHTRDAGDIATVAVMSTSGADSHDLASDADYLTAMTWNADGSRVIYAGLNGIRGVAADGSDDGVFIVDAFAAMGPDLSPDGTELCYGRNGDTMQRADLTQTPPALIDLGIRGQSPRYSPDGTKIAFWTYDTLQLMDLATMAITDVATDELNNGFGGVDWFSDGQRLLAGTDRGIELITLGPPISRVRLWDELPMDVDLSPDEASVAYGRNGDASLYILSGF